MTDAMNAQGGAVVDIVAERQRQIHREGYLPDHDDRYVGGTMAHAAAAYALSGGGTDDFRRRFGHCSPPAPWPWEEGWWKPRDRRRDLVRAGALIVAEIERLDRAAQKAEAK
ncbi:hypothetical protein [Brevundimonas nasdae]|uniref:hypothetical protein n=1 Tax=Brevundimonas nasdae TaxID=172043 RepID=UPI003F693BC9